MSGRKWVMKAREALIAMMPGLFLGTAPFDATAAEEKFISASELQQLCESPRNSESWGLCHGYMIGFASAEKIHRALGAPYRALRVCNSSILSSNQMVAIFEKWARYHPNGLSEPAEAGLLEALVNEYPCQAE